MEHILSIKIFGETFSLKAEDVEHAENVAELLQSEVEKAQEDFKSNITNITKFSILLVASLNVSREYYELKNKYENLLSSVSDRSENILQKINRSDPEK